MLVYVFNQETHVDIVVQKLNKQVKLWTSCFKIVHLTAKVLQAQWKHKKP